MMCFNFVYDRTKSSFHFTTFSVLDGGLRSGSEPPLNRHRRRNDIAPLPLAQASPSPQPPHVEPWVFSACDCLLIPESHALFFHANNLLCSDEIDQRYREIMRNSGNLRFGSSIVSRPELRIFLILQKCLKRTTDNILLLYM